MGGSGSGRWHYHSKATTVEECRVLDLTDLARQGAFKPWHTGVLRWLRGHTEIASAGYIVEPDHTGSLTLRVSYRRVARGEHVDLPIALEATPLHFGGRRWWGRCPLAVGGRACRRRVAKLYLPPGAGYF